MYTFGCTNRNITMGLKINLYLHLRVNIETLTILRVPSSDVCVVHIAHIFIELSRVVTSIYPN